MEYTAFFGLITVPVEHLLPLGVLTGITIGMLIVEAIDYIKSHQR